MLALTLNFKYVDFISMSLLLVRLLLNLLLALLFGLYLALFGSLHSFHLFIFKGLWLTVLIPFVSFEVLHLFTVILNSLFKFIPFFLEDIRCAASFAIHILCGFDILILIGEVFFHILCAPLELMQHLLLLNLNLKFHRQDYFALHNNHLPLLLLFQNYLVILLELIYFKFLKLMLLMRYYLSYLYLINFNLDLQYFLLILHLYLWIYFLILFNLILDSFYFKLLSCLFFGGKSEQHLKVF